MHAKLIAQTIPANIAKTVFFIPQNPFSLSSDQSESSDQSDKKPSHQITSPSIPSLCHLTPLVFTALGSSTGICSSSGPKPAAG